VARALGLVALAVAIGMLALLDYPSVLGRWEGFGTFSLLPGPPPPLALEITAGGYVYNMSQSRYALVDLGYYTAEWLGWSLTAFRLPVLVAGAGSVALFFVIARRELGFWPALFGALSLALTPAFLVLWHQNIVPVLSVLFLLLVIERYQYVERAGYRRSALLWGLPTLAVAFALLLLHYGPGRAYGGVVVGWWTATIGWRAIRARRAGCPLGRPRDRWMLLAVPAFVLLVGAVLVLMSPRNAHFLVEPTELLDSPQSEFVKSSDQLKWVLANVPIVLTALVPPLGLVPGRFAEFSTDLLADYRYYLLPTVLVPFGVLGLWVMASRVLLGLGVAVGRALPGSTSTGRVQMGQTGGPAMAGLTLVLLAATLAAPLFSSGASISVYRMLFALVPLSLCVAAGAGWLLARQSPSVRYGATGLLVAALAILAGQLGAEVTRHRVFVADFAQRWTSTSDLRQFAGPVDRGVRPDDEVLSNGSYRYYVQEGGVAALAAAYRLHARIPAPTTPNEVALIQLDGPVVRDDPSSAVKLVFFLRELGVPAAYFDPALQRLRGAGWGHPTYVIALNGVAASGARRQLEAAGLTVRLREYKP
jgi:hypothetical protein